MCVKNKCQKTLKQRYLYAAETTEPFVRDLLRRTVYHHYRHGIPVTVDGLIHELNDDLKKEEISFNPSHSQMHRILRGMGYHYAKINRTPIIFEREDIVEWRRNYLRLFYIKFVAF
jgi:hypothetical protein